MAVVFSHGFSAFIALILVPTVRLQMMSMENGRQIGHSPIEKHLRKLEDFYARAIAKFINNPRVKYATYSALCAALALLIALVLPKLPKEIIGTPDTDFIRWNISSRDNTQSRQMEEQVDEIEAKLLSKFGDKIAYTYTRIWNATDANVMIRLKDKAMGEKFKTALEEEFTNTPTMTFRARKWNPSEMKIPMPPDLEISVRGDNAKSRLSVADEVKEFLRNKKFYRDAWSTPSTDLVEVIKLKPAVAQLFSRSSGITFEDVADLARVATDGRKIGSLPVDTVPTDIVMKYPDKRVNSLEDLVSLPIGVAGKIVPLNAFAQVAVEREEPELHRVDGQSLVKIEAYLSENDKTNATKIFADAQSALQAFLKEKNFDSGISVTVEDAGRDLTKALDQLGIAVALSILFIFLTMIFQFGDIASAALVLVSIPLGFIGVLTSLFVFGSTLSLNSALGVILLNGISVANSIILVDFLKRLVNQGVPPALAAQQAAKKRLRPILMTSLTTALGMLPIALGMGDGGKILQPLGIAVIGGLGFSMLTTLFVVPSLQVAYLEWRQFKRVMDEDEMPITAAPTGDLLPLQSPSATVMEHDA
jgi:hydrophobic/amphiphilic exporter-1 (mainly G- bacteria), HAE1 family